MNIIIKQIVCISMIIMCAFCTACGGEELIVTGVSSEDNSELSVHTGEDNDGTSEFSEQAEDSIVVYVCGAVQNIGVYELPYDSRVNDALEAAGGFSDDADTDMVNLADILTDGQKVYFPVEGESGAAGTDEASSDREAGLVNINTAGVSELTALPGIGDTRARSIVEYRQTHGSFASKDELKAVSGIGDSIYSNLEAYITVD